jgi:hypothetical protein
MPIERRLILFQISMPCSTVATAFKLASPIEIVENKRGLVARYRYQVREGDGVSRILGYNLLSGISWDVGVGRLIAFERTGHGACRLFA